jgi:peptidoglycan/LPS O-acetylase OafA/YrhL
VVSALLPPAYRETVLGDLQERFGDRGPRARTLGYMSDVVTTVPQVLLSQMRRGLMRGSACAGAVPGNLRRRAEKLQARVWIRNAVGFASVVLVAGAFLINARGPWHFQELVNLAMTLGWIGAAWQSYGVRGRSTTVPASLSWDELRAFHRRELIRQRNLGILEFVYWFVPAVCLILYALTRTVPGFRGGASLLVAIGMQIVVIASAHGIERRRLQREMDRLEQEVEEPV